MVEMARRAQYLKQGNTLTLMDYSWVGAAEEEPRKKEEPIEYKILPELKKLDTLDKQEKQLTARLNKGAISGEDYDNIINAMDLQRESLVKKLEKKGYFPREEASFDYEEAPVKPARAPLTYEAKVAIGFVAFAVFAVFKMVLVGP